MMFLFYLKYILSVTGKIIIYSSILIYLFYVYLNPDYLTGFRKKSIFTGHMTAGQ